MKKNNYFLGLLLMVCCAFQACSEDSFDVEGNTENLIYFNSSNFHPIEMPNTSQSFTLISTPVGFFGQEVLAKFSVCATRPMGSAAMVNAVIDLSLVDDFNETHGTNYVSCPFAVLQKSSVEIASGSYNSSDSLVLVIPEEKYQELTAKAYLIPICLESSSHGMISTKAKVAYVVVNIEQRLINEEAAVTDIIGEGISDKSTWTVSTTDLSVTDFSLLFDGNAATGVRFGNEEIPTIILDMGEENNVTAFFFKNSNSAWGSYYNFSSISIALSSDGQSWEEAGSTSPIVTDKTNQYVILYGAVNARFVRLSLKWIYGAWGNTYRTFNEMEVYAE